MNKKNRLLCVSCLLITVLFSSCENFLNGGDISKVIDDAIAYAKAESFAVRFSGTNGDISPNGEQHYKATDEFPLIFTEKPEYCFVKWQVLREGKVLSESEADSIIHFEQKESPDTKVKILKKENALTIQALCVERPKVVGSTPQFDYAGVYRDRRLNIIFNKKIEESSFYWTEAELRSLGISDFNPAKVFEATGKKDKNDNQYYYGYVDSNNQIVYKGIRITTVDGSKNLLEYYGMPELDDFNAMILQLPTKKGDKAPPASTLIQVYISEDIYSYDELVNQNVTVCKEKLDFMYRTGGSVDSQVPAYGAGFTVQFGTSEDKKDLSTTLIDEPTSIKQNNMYGKKIWCKGTVEDTGSGPSTLQWNVRKIDENHYPLSKLKPFEWEGQLVDVKYDPTTATVDESIDLSNIPFTEGLYKFTLTAYDQNENGNSKEFYFVYDNTGPTVFPDRSKITNSRASASSETIIWEKPLENSDFDHVIIEQWDGSTKIATYDQSTNAGLSHQFTELTNQKKYKYRFYSVDFFGNKSASYIEWQDDIGPDPVTDAYGSGKKSNKVHLFFDTPNTEDFAHVEIQKLTGAGDSYIVENVSIKKINGTSSSGTSIDQKQKHYEVRPNSNASENSHYRIYAVDYSGNKSKIAVDVWQGYAQPGMIVYQNKKGTSGEEILVSNNFYEGKNPIGILYAINADVLNGRRANLVYDIKEYSGYVWGEYDRKPEGRDTEPHYDGLKDYNNFLENFAYSCVGNIKAYNPSTGKNEYRDTVWKYLRDTQNANNSLTWYLPACDDFKLICGNISSLNKGAATLKNHGVSVTLQGDNYLGTSSLYSSNQMYRIKKNSVTSGNWSWTSDDSQKDRIGICNWHFVTEINLD